MAADIKGAGSRITSRVSKGIINAAGEALQMVTNVTPHRKGELRTKRQVRVISEKEIKIYWFARHAAVQEAGKRRGARAFARYSTPGTGKGFAKKTKEEFLRILPRHIK